MFKPGVVSTGYTYKIASSGALELAKVMPSELIAYKQISSFMILSLLHYSADLQTPMMQNVGRGMREGLLVRSINAVDQFANGYKGKEGSWRRCHRLSATVGKNGLWRDDRQARLGWLAGCSVWQGPTLGLVY